MAHLSLSLLGPPQARLDGLAVAGFESQKVRALLAYLAVEATRPHARDALAGLLWPEQPDHDARNNLRQALANLRQALGDQRARPPFLLIAGATIQFNRASDHQLDVAAFSALLDACDRHPHRHAESCTSCARRLHQAVDLYHGDFLDQFFLSDSAAFEEWALLTRERLHHRAIAALAQLADYHERRGDDALAERYTRRLLELDPWREQSHRQLMRLLARGGQRSAALMQYATCRRVLADELGIAPEEATTALYARIERGEALTDAQPVPTTNLAAHTPPTPLIGRETERAQLADRLEQRDCRLLTLVGPGGIGKTRLALQAASDLRMSFRDGVAFVALAPLHAAEFVVPAIAGALGFALHGPADPKSQLLAYLRAKDMLLVLDNFEHLLAAAPLVSELLAACPDLAVLATSRAPLHVRGEQQFPVPPLALPPVDDRRPTTDDKLIDVVGRRLSVITHYAAVQLFTQRAQAVQPNFTLTEANALDVATICARLDGLPLAIELAATRVKLLPLPALLARLDNRLKLLTGGARDQPARQQTIRATIVWSYDLLEADTQPLFRRLAVFVGGCTLESAEAVCNASGDLPLDVLDGLAMLVDTSLLRQEEGTDGEPRFTMLETIREYALERLEASGEAEALRRWHAEYFLALAETAEPELHRAQQLAWLQRLEQEHDNVRAALAWSQTSADGVETGLRLAGALGWFWERRGHWSEGRMWLISILAHPMAGPTAARAKALNQAGFLADSPSQAEALFGESLAIGRALGDTTSVADALRGLGRITAASLLERKQPLLEESLALSQELGDTWRSAMALHGLALLAEMQGDFERAIAPYEESLTLFRQLGDRWGSVQSTYQLLQARMNSTQSYSELMPQATEILAEWRQLGDKGACAEVLNGLGELRRYQGEYGRAAIYYAESLALWQELGDRSWIALVRNNQGWLAHNQGNEAQAAVLWAESLALAHEIADQLVIPWCLAGLGFVAMAQGRAERAARLLGAAKAPFDATGSLTAPVDRAEFDRSAAAARAHLGDDAFAAAWAAGRALPLEQAIAEALRMAG